MKKILMLALAALALLVVGCEQPVVGGPSTGSGTGAVPPGAVVISLGGASTGSATDRSLSLSKGAARTVVPTAPAGADAAAKAKSFTWYKVTITGGDDPIVLGDLAAAEALPTGNADEIAARTEAIAAAEAVAAALKTTGQLVVEGLVAGTEYSVTVEAFNTHTTTVTPGQLEAVVETVTAHYLAAAGSATLTPTATGPNNAPVTLATFTEADDTEWAGNGVFAWDIGYPAGAAYGSLVLTLVSGGPPISLLLSPTFALTGGTLEGSAAIPAGVYNLEIYFSTLIYETATFTERVYIYPGLVSTADKDTDETFAIAGFEVNLTLAGTVNATHTGSGWTGYPAMTVRVTCANPSYTSETTGDFAVTMLGDTGLWTATLPRDVFYNYITVSLVVTPPDGFVATLTPASATDRYITNLIGNPNGPALSVGFAAIPTLGAGGDYTTLADAIAGVPNGTAENPTVITVLSNVDMGATVMIADGKHIKLVAETTATLKRLADAMGSLFKVTSGGSLTIGSGITVDGNMGVVSDAGGPLVDVAGGAFTLEAGATLKDNATTGNGGGVSVSSGTFTMKGGAISGNNAGYGGGGAVVGGTFTMQGGAISGNSAEFGGGVAVGAGSFTLAGGTVYGSGEGGGLANTDSNGGAALSKGFLGTAVFGAGGGSVGGDPRGGGSAIATTNETIVGAGA
jgi:hypothetical protein